MASIQFVDVAYEQSDYEIDLSKLMDKRIKAVVGYISMEFGDPMFKLTRIIFVDGTFLGVEGEHDLPYLSWYRLDDIGNLNDETLIALYKEQNPDD